MTLLMPFSATILAFMMGSEMESKSAGHSNRHTHTQMRDKEVSSTSCRDPFVQCPTHVGNHGLGCGPMADQGLHLLLLLLLLSLLVQEVLQQEGLLLQQQGAAFVLVLVQVLIMDVEEVGLGHLQGHWLRGNRH